MPRGLTRRLEAWRSQPRRRIRQDRWSRAKARILRTHDPIRAVLMCLAGVTCIVGGLVYADWKLVGMGMFVIVLAAFGSWLI